MYTFYAKCNSLFAYLIHILHKSRRRGTLLCFYAYCAIYVKCTSPVCNLCKVCCKLCKPVTHFCATCVTLAYNFRTLLVRVPRSAPRRIGYAGVKVGCAARKCVLGSWPCTTKDLLCGRESWPCGAQMRPGKLAARLELKFRTVTYGNGDLHFM